MMMPHRWSAIAKGVQGNWFQFYIGRTVDVIDHFLCWKKTIKCVGDFLSSKWRNVDASPILVSAHTQVIWSNVVNRFCYSSRCRIFDGNMNSNEFLEKAWNVSSESFFNDKRIALLP